MQNFLKQINASYSQSEDRILLKLRTDQQQFQAWITRRYLLLLIPSLQGQHPSTKVPLFSEKKQATHTMQQQGALQDVKKQAAAQSLPYEVPSAVEEPLGSAPILLTKLTFKGIDTENPTISFEPESGKGFSLSFHPQVTSALIIVLKQALNNSDWNLDLDPVLDMPEQVTLQ